MYYRITLLFTLLVLFTQAQTKPLREYQVDSASYKQYTEGRRGELEILTKQALQQGIDFYYLRMRIGVLEYNDKRYALAEDHFLRALEFYPIDTIAQEYLFYTYVFLNKNLESGALYEKMDEHLQKKVKNDKPLNYAITIESGYMSSNATQQYNLRSVIPPPYHYAEVDASKDLAFGSVGFSANLENRSTLYLGYHYLNLNKQKDFFTADMMGPRDTSYAYTYQQFGYYIGLNNKIGRKGNLRFGVNFFDYITGSPYSENDTTTKKLTYKNYDYKQSNVVTNIGYSHQLGAFLKPSLDLSYSNIGKVDCYQAMFKLNYFPKGNLNFYGYTGIAGIADSTGSHMVFMQKLGGKVSKRTWLETYLFAGNLKNMNDENAYVLYNITDKISAKLGLSLTIFANKHLELNLRVDRLMRQSSFKTEMNPMMSEIRSYNYFNNSITGGIKWKF